MPTRKYFEQIMENARELGRQIDGFKGVARDRAAASLKSRLREKFADGRATPLENILLRMKSSDLAELIVLKRSRREGRKFDYLMDSLARQLAYDIHEETLHTASFLANYLEREEVRKAFFNEKLREACSALGDEKHRIYLTRLLAVADNPQSLAVMVGRVHDTAERKKEAVTRIVDLLKSASENSTDLNATISLLAKTEKREFPAAIEFLELLHPPRFLPSKDNKQLREQMEGLKPLFERDAKTRELFEEAVGKARSYGKSLERTLALIERVRSEGSEARLREAARFLQAYYSRFPTLEHHEFSAYRFPRD